MTFEKETAARTALLLNNTMLGDNKIAVTSDVNPDEESYKHDHDGEHYRDGDEITPEMKPKSRILAEYLAHGYLVADTGLQSALAADEKHGISQRFLTTLHSLDAKYHASDRARTADQSYGITQRANSLLGGLSSYFEKASNTPTGQRIVKFYSDGQRQVSDIHNEARRLAELRKQEHGGSAYKAAGLDRVFGPEKTAKNGGGASAPGAAPSDAPATESSQKPTAPANVPGNQETTTQIPKA